MDERLPADPNQSILDVRFVFEPDEWDVLLIARVLEGKSVADIIRGAVTKSIEEAKKLRNYKIALSLRDQHRRQMQELRRPPEEVDPETGEITGPGLGEGEEE